MKHILLLSFFLFTLGLAQAQNRERVQELKVNFIIKKLGLDDKTAANFRPIYIEYEKAKQQVYQNYRRNNPGDKIEMDDIENRLENEQNMLNLKKEYVNKFARVLSPAQISQMRNAEGEFRHMVAERIREKRSGGGYGNGDGSGNGMRRGRDVPNPPRAQPPTNSRPAVMPKYYRPEAPQRQAPGRNH